MASPSIVVCGLDRFGLAVVNELVRRGAGVFVVAPAEQIARYEVELDRLGVRRTSGAAHSEGVLVHAGLEQATALVLTADDVSDNIDAAIAARRVNAAVRIVIRVFEADLGEFVRESLGDIVVLSVSAVAAPIFADLARKAAEASAANPSPRAALSSPRPSRRAPDRVLIGLAAAFATIVVVAVLYFGEALGLSPIDALYFVGTTISTTGYGDISLLNEGAFTKLMGIALMFSGAALLTTLFGLISSWFVERRIEVLEGRVPVRGSGHMLLCGAGNVGYRVAEQLRESGQKVVVVERKQESPNAIALRLAGHHVIRADATNESTLRLAHVERARVVLALTDDDTANLRIGRTVAEISPNVPVILRIVSAELAAHIDARGSHGRIRLSSPVAVAAVRFAEAALESKD